MQELAQSADALASASGILERDQWRVRPLYLLERALAQALRANPHRFKQRVDARAQALAQAVDAINRPLI